VNHGRPHFAGISDAERKKFRIFFIFFSKMFGILIFYINFDEQ
jgi:hypothetical protein